MNNFKFENTQHPWSASPVSGYQPNPQTGLPTQDVTPSLFGYGTDGSSFSRRSGFKPLPEVKNCCRTYALDAVQNAWFETQLVNGHPRKRTPLTTGFGIVQVVVITNPVTDSICSAVVQYVAGAEYTAHISADDFRSGRFAKYFSHVHRLPGCTKSQVNDLIGFLIAQAPTITLTLYPRQGFIQHADSTVVFAANPTVSAIPQHEISESLRIRPALFGSNLPFSLEFLWNSLAALHPLIRLLLLMRVGSLLLFWLEPIQITPCSLLIVSPSACVSEEQLAVLLSTNDTRLHRILSIESSRSVLLNELSLVWDGVAVISDKSLADESDIIEPSLRHLIKEAGSANGNGRNSIVLISKFAPFAAQRIAAENVLSVSMEGVTLDLDCERVRQIVQVLDAVVIQTVLRISAHERNTFFGKLRALPPHCQHFSDHPLSDLVPFFISAEAFLEEFCQRILLNKDKLKEQLIAITQNGQSAVSADQLIVQDFATVLSKSIRNGEITVIQKQQKLCIDSDQDVLLVEGDRFYISGELIDYSLRSSATVHMRSSLLAALRQSHLLNTTDGSTKPLQVYDRHGSAQRLYWYCIDASILDADILHRLHNFENEQFWLSPAEVPDQGFLPLLRDESGRVAGRRIRQEDVENGHTYLTGQSGTGKTYETCQLMAKTSALGHLVVTLDNSGSATYEAMCRNLSQSFVDANVTFIDVDSDHIPVDLFRIDRSASKPTQKAALRSILTAGVGELTAPQRSKLNTALSGMLDLLAPDEPIRTDEILAMLNEEGATYESLRSRFEPLFEDLDAIGMASHSWDELLRQNAGKIIVIRTASGSAEHGDQLIDLMLATLCRYQKAHPEIPLDLFIDEIQNQNLSKDGPISWILREGRKYGIAFFGATQDFFPFNTALGRIMSKADTQIFLHPTPDSEQAVASELRFKKGDTERFDNMMRGDAIIKASFYSRENKRNIPATLSGHLVPYPLNESNDQQ